MVLTKDGFRQVMKNVSTILPDVSYSEIWTQNWNKSFWTHLSNIFLENFIIYFAKSHLDLFKFDFIFSFKIKEFESKIHHFLNNFQDYVGFTDKFSANYFNV